MAWVVLEGYHSQAKYQQLRDGDMIFEETPLLYASHEGTYECQVTADGDKLAGIFRIDHALMFP